MGSITKLSSFFVSQDQNESSWGNFSVENFSGFENIHGEDGGFHDVPSERFLSHSAGKFPCGTLLCFRFFLVSKKFMDKTWRGVTVMVNIFCHIPAKLHRWTIFCFRKFLVTKFFKQTSGGIKVLAKIFSHSTKKIIDETLCVSGSIWYQPKLIVKRGLSSISVKVFSKHCAENFPREPFSFSENFRYRNIFRMRGGGLLQIWRKSSSQYGKILNLNDFVF